MPTYSTGGQRAEFIPFQNPGPWRARFVNYREQPSKDKLNNDGSVRVNAFLEFQITEDKVLAKYPDTPVMKTYICNAYLYKSADGKRTSHLFEALKAISGVEPERETVAGFLGKKPEELKDDDLFAWIGSLYERVVQVVLNPIETRNGFQDQTVKQILPLFTDADDGGL